MFIIHDQLTVFMTYVLVAYKREKNVLLVSRGPGLLIGRWLKTSLRLGPDVWDIHTVVIFYTRSSVKCM